MSEVDICNLALSHLGDTAQVMSIKPPDASVQAQLSARFYPVARDAVLEMGTWGFATRRVALAQVANPTLANPTLAIAQAADATATAGTWLYAYAVPSDVMNVIAILSASAPDDYEASLWGSGAGDCLRPFPQGYVPVPGARSYTPQPFAAETQADGTEIILTNVPDAFMRYTATVTDTTKFSPLFTVALSWLLASMLAGPILKGDAGAAAGERCLAMFMKFEGEAESSDANQRKTNVEAAVAWIRGR